MLTDTSTSSRAVPHRDFWLFCTLYTPDKFHCPPASNHSAWTSNLTEDQQFIQTWARPYFLTVASLCWTMRCIHSFVGTNTMLYTLYFVYLTIIMTYSHTSYFYCNLIHVPVHLYVSGSRVGASGSAYPAFRFQVPHPSRAKQGYYRMVTVRCTCHNRSSIAQM